MPDSERNPEEWRRVKQILADVLEQPEDRRAGFLDAVCAGDATLRRRIEALVRAEAEPWSFVDGAAAGTFLTRDLSGRQLGAYEVVEEIGRGGMGAVYLARRQGDFDRRVAIKVARPGLADPEALRRFLAERQIAATLEHPNIARLLDGGATPEGEPYFVMEYVDGEPLLAYCRDRDLTLDERLALFRQVCAAVGFAHRNLIVHRDIKPANILVTREGTPKLLDFGIAKLLAEDSGEERSRTATMFRALTPEYASPEQVRGEPITTASDIYSLGVVLYELLTGERPYTLATSEHDELVRVVCEVDPVRPSAAVTRSRDDSAAAVPRGETAGSLARRLRGDLDAIAMKAMRKEPENRYASVAELSDDLDRFRRGLPVAARQGTISYRVAKFSRRHRAGLAATALVLLAVCAGLAATLREARRAREAEARAERRFRDVRTLANFFLNDFYDAIRFLPGSTPARQLIVQRGLAYLDSLSLEAGDDPSLLRDLAEGYQHLGDVQGNPAQGSSMLGDMPGAQKTFRRAADVRERLAASATATRQDRLALARIDSLLADSYTLDGEYRQAIDLARRSVGLMSKEIEAAPSDPEVLRQLAHTQINLGSALKMANHPDEALAAFQSALAVYEKLFTSDPSDIVDRRRLFVAYYKIGALENSQKRYDRAVDVFRRAVSLAGESHRREPGNGAVSRDYSFALEGLGESLVSVGQLREAVDILSSRRALQQELADADPSDANARIWLAEGTCSLGEARIAAGDAAAGIRDLQESRAMTASLVAKHPDDVSARMALAHSFAALGGATEGAESRAWLEKARDVYLGLRRDGKLAPAVEALLARVEEQIAESGGTR